MARVYRDEGSGYGLNQPGPITQDTSTKPPPAPPPYVHSPGLAHTPGNKAYVADAAVIPGVTGPYTPPGTPGGGGDGSGNDKNAGGDKTAPPAPTDWSIVLGTYGLPKDLVDELNKIWQASGGISSTATPLAMNYVMSSDWFKTNYPGYFTGLNKGMYGDIRGYVSYQNDLNLVYNQYFKRPPTATEIGDTITAGKPISLVSSEFQSQATLGTLSDPIKALFTSDELKAYTDERSGIDSALGQKMLGDIDTYTKINPLFQSFYNRGVTRTELDNLVQNGTDPSQVSQQFKAQGYLDAISPTLKNVFSPDELQQMANEAAGGDTPHGKQLMDMANLATSLNEVYQIHYGAGVTRDELNLAYSQGYTAQHVDAMLQSGEYANSLPANVKALFTPDELKQAGEQASGFSSSDAGMRTLNIVKGAGDYAKLASQYGENLTGDQLKNFYDTGLTANDYGSQLAGKAFANANGNEIQQTAGAFGGGLLTADQLQSIGSEKAGYDTPQGQQLVTAYNKALTRMNGAFQGVLARSGDFSSLQARKSVQAESSDVPA